MFCLKCGRQIPDKTDFCNYCGAAQEHILARFAEMQPQPKEQPYVPRQDDEKAFRQYITPHGFLYAFIVLAVIAVAGGVSAPPLAIGFGFVAILLGIVFISSNHKAKKCIAQAKATGTYNKMLKEFVNSSSMLKDSIRYSENYLFGKNACRFFAYKDIYWLYRHNLTYSIFTVRSDIMIGNSRGKVEAFCRMRATGKAATDALKALAAIVLEKNPRVLLGFDAAKQAEYKRRTK